MPIGEKQPGLERGGVTDHETANTILKSPGPPAARETANVNDRIELALVSSDLKMPRVVQMFDTSPAIVRGNPTASERFSVLRPISTVISEDQPTFSWTTLAGATTYRVDVYDANLRLIKSSSAVSGTRWTMPTRLSRGVVYTWLVTAVRDGKEVIAPAPPARAEFTVLKNAELTILTDKVQTTASHAARGVLYAKAGMLDEAEKELQTHLGSHPSDACVRRLLETIRSWRRAEH